MSRKLQKSSIASAPDYEEFCRKVGISFRQRKTQLELAREREAYQRYSCETVLRSAKRFSRHPEEVLRTISAGGPLDPHFAKRPFLCHIHALFVSVQKHRNIREAFLQLLLATNRVCTFENLEPVTHRYGGTYASGLLAVARRHAEWQTTLNGWQPTSHNPRRQFRELLAHLFCRYDAPAFLETAWFRSPDDRTARQQQDWFLHTGRGNNPRHLVLPITLTKRMAHIASTQIPADCSVEEGWRWAQVTGMGGSERLARAVLGTRLAEGFHEEPFWETVLRFFVDNPLLDPARVGPLVDYLWHERYSRREPGEIGRLPRDFVMKGRTPAALLSRMEAWHKSLARTTRINYDRWEASGIGTFSYEEKSGPATSYWTVEELTTAKALTAEGSAMGHCVGTYASSCARGVVSVWSLRVVRLAESEKLRVMTLAVNKNRMITEARGKRNALPTATAADFGMRLSKDESALLVRGRRIVGMWARTERLGLPNYLQGEAM